MHRDADGACLIRNGARDGLPHPPGCIGRKLIAAAVFKLVDGLHEADIAFLNQVEELEPAVGVALGDRNHQAQVGFNQFFFRALSLLIGFGDDQVRAPQFRGRGAVLFFELLHALQMRALFAPEIFPRRVGGSARQ